MACKDRCIKSPFYIFGPGFYIDLQGVETEKYENIILAGAEVWFNLTHKQMEVRSYVVTHIKCPIPCWQFKNLTG